MTSPEPSFVATSPISPSTARHRRIKSRFTYKTLSLLGSYSPTCPLRCIAHVDLDAFYAQCEMVRLGLPPDKPLAVQQWQGLIAINYPARAFGLSRHVTVEEARAKCPDIVTQHVATWKEGEARWAYHDDAYKNMSTHKVSLDPYRLQSRRILALIKDNLPPSPMQRVEKASVDEVFLDLSAQVHSMLLQRYPELRGPPPYDDPSEQLPAPPTSALDWGLSDALVDLDPGEAEEDAPDWDDVAMLLGAEVVRDLRDKVRQQLGYTCSAGVARNKMLAKLGSGHQKPNAQTIVRNRAVARFLSGFKVTKIRNLGGKLGDEVVGHFGTDAIDELLRVPQEALMKKLGDDTGTWLHGVLRGTDTSEVTPRTQIKSMLSAKSFRPPLNAFEPATRWLRIFAADIYARLVDDGLLTRRRRPATLSLHHRQGATTRSRSAPIPAGAPVTEDALAAQARDLLAHVVVDGRAWPCANLSLSVTGFDDGPPAGTQGIGAFLVKGGDAKPAAPPPPPDDDAEHDDTAPPAKRQRTTASPPANRAKGINAFFARAPTPPPSDFDAVPSAQRPPSHARDVDADADAHPDTDAEVDAEQEAQGDETRCPRCSRALAPDDAAEHADWHVARDLQASEDAAVAPPTSHVAPEKARHGRGRPRGGRTGVSSAGGHAGGAEKGQMKLRFG